MFCLSKYSNDLSFSATFPNSLLEFINNKVRTLEDEKEKIKELIPSLLAKQKALEKVQYSRVFEGMRGLRALFYELFETNKEEKEICVLGLNELLKEKPFLSFFRFYHDFRRKNNIKLKLVLNEYMREFIEVDYKKMKMLADTDEVKFINTTYPVGVFIFGDHVINIIADEEVTAFDVKSKQNAERFRKFFYSIWDKV